MKGKIDTVLKVFVMVFTMLMGVFFTYAFVWFLLELPVETWAIVLLFALAALTMVGFVFWIKGNDEEDSVVYCEDCKHYMTIHCTCDGCCISDDWYCADGERR